MTGTTNMNACKPVKILLKKDFSPHKRFEYNFTIYDRGLRDNFVITIPGNLWIGEYSDFTVRQWENFTGQSFYNTP